MPTSTPAPGASTHESRDSEGKETESKSAHSALTSQTETEDSAIGTAESYYKQLDDFFENPDNASAISSAKDALSAALKATNIEEQFDTFAQTSNIIVSGLDILGKIHPFISIAAQAFKLVIEVDLKRRENDGKVLAVRLQMQDMIVILFDLRDISKEKVGRLTEVMELIAKHITAARNDKREVQSSLALYTADGVSEIKKQMQKLFSVLETSREREVRGIIGKNEAQDYIGNKELQQQLFAEGEKFLTPSQLASERKSLQKELEEKVDEVLEKHVALFTSQLEKQNGRLLQTILAAVDNGPYTKILDPDLREVWHAHHWPDPIRGQNFISGLSEYYKKKFSSQQRDSEHWVVDYIDIAATKLIEAVDDDGSQFLSAEEINNFTAPKPKDWSLTQWIVFWIAGWHPTVAWYKGKDRSHPAIAVDSSFAIRPSRQSMHVEPRLNFLMEDFRRLEEELLKTRLEKRFYFLDQRATVQEVSNHQRIDHYIFPLLYLLLNHHRDTMQRAGREHSEFTKMSTSLDSIFEAVEWRVDVLKEKFRMNSLDVEKRFEEFSCGMFHLLYNLKYGEHDEQKNSSQNQNEQSPQKQMPDAQDRRPVIRGGVGGEGGYGGKQGGPGGLGEAAYMSLEAVEHFKEIIGGVGGKGGMGGSEGVGGPGGIGEGNKFREKRITEEWLVQPNPDVKVTDLHELDEAIRRLLIANGYRTVGGLVKATENDLKEAGLTVRGQIHQLKATLEKVPPKK
ncbi:hypothetical protein MSAN_00218100 [Mycena sanguinolenta]|uniref:EF-hand domain-containing protein n=1 Tax=Mycena sanguinolenta TaxID=230812 RepID=A0A8H6ZHL8_9AGAR|nr:hypothetical protein MSAN_00218100 [Mycena sanguinolenta]